MYKNIIKEICSELNIKYTFLSKDWIIMLEKNNKTKFISGYKFDLNSHAEGNCIDDKYAMYEVLKYKNIPVIEHRILYDEKNREPYARDSKDRKIVFDYFDKYKTIVLKSNTGTCGRDVYKIENKEEINEVLDKLFQKNFSISICPFYEIDNEYRAIVLNGEVKIIYSKERPIVYGDGKKLLSELLKEFNPSYHYHIDKDYVLNKDKKYIYSWKHNLSNGSTINMNIDNKEYLINLAKNTAKSLNLVFGSVDIIRVKDKYYILECNSGVMMDNLIKILPDGYNIAKNIYKEAILKMFEME